MNILESIAKGFGKAFCSFGIFAISAKQQSPPSEMAKEVFAYQN